MSGVRFSIVPPKNYMEDYFKKEKEFKENHKVRYFLREAYYECTYRTWRRIVDCKDEVKWAFQRAFRGYDNTAYWSLYSYLTNIALPVLRDYRKNKHGIPSMVMRKGESFKKSEERWNEILDKMIYAFQVIKEDRSYINPPEVDKKVQEGLKLFGKYYQTLWD